MLLSRLRLAGKVGDYTLLLKNGKIATVCPSSQLPASTRGGIVLFLPGTIAFPGLTNSHDHLDFNLFPLTGNKVYSNYTEWGKDIHEKNKAAIDAILRIPLNLRIRWGQYKNLLNGFTTVVNHGVPLIIGQELITVFQESHNLHSVGFEKNWKWKLNLLSRKKTVVMHVGEGTNSAASREIDRLIRWNLFKKKLVGVHGVAMNEQQAKHFKALVWCPGSNYFLLQRTAAVGQLKHELKILFGTDSTLTSSWNSWDQIRMARKERMLSDPELLAMLTTTAADVWDLPDIGTLTEGAEANLVIARPDDATKADSAALDSFFSLNPRNLELVVHKGNIRLFDRSLLAGLIAGGFDANGFYKISLQGKEKYVEGNLPELMLEIQQYHGQISFPEELAPILNSAQTTG